MMRRKFDLRRRQIGFGGQQLRLAGGELRLGLRDVGARDLADVETVLGLLQRLFEDADVALLNLDDRGVAQIVHVDGGGLQQHGLFEHPQRFARARNLALCRAGPVGGLLAVEQRLRRRWRRRCAASWRREYRLRTRVVGVPPAVLSVSVYW